MVMVIVLEMVIGMQIEIQMEMVMWMAIQMVRDVSVRCCVLLASVCVCVSCVSCALLLPLFFLSLLTIRRRLSKLAGPSCAGPAQGQCRTFNIPHIEF